MERREGAREGLGLMGIGGGVFAVAALVAAVASPLAGELTKTIHSDVAPVAQASVSALAPAGSTAVRVVRMPPLRMLPGESVLGFVEDDAHARGRGLRLRQTSVKRAPAPHVAGAGLSAPAPAPAPAAAPAPAPAAPAAASGPAATTPAADQPGRAPGTGGRKSEPTGRSTRESETRQTRTAYSASGDTDGSTRGGRSSTEGPNPRRGNSGFRGR